MLFKKIVKTAVVGEDSRKGVVSTVTRGAVGAFALGPVGLVAAATGKNKKTTTFVIEYSDGSRETKTVKTNSSEYKRLAKYIVF